jgi:O-antigen/teichoic acid export membrane protein
MTGHILGHLVTVAFMPVLTRMYAPADFALFSLFLTATTFSALLTFRYEYTVQLPETEGEARGVCCLVLSMGLAMTVLATPLAWMYRKSICAWMDAAPLESWLVAVPIVGVLLSLSVALQGWTQRERRFRLSGSAEVVDKSVRQLFPTVIGMVSPYAGGLIIGLVGSTIAKIVWLGTSGAFGCLQGGIQQAPCALRKQAQTGLSLTISHFFLAGTAAVPVVYLMKLDGAAVLGQFSLAVSLVALPTTLAGNAIGNVYFQRAAESWRNGKDFRGLWQSTAPRLIWLGLPVYTTAALFLPWAVPFVFGPAWEQAGEFSSILSVGAFFSFISTPLDRACLVVGAYWYVPAWHAGRLVSLMAIAWYASVHTVSPTSFLIMFTIQQTVLYLIDYWAEWGFTGLKPKAEAANGA